jgi:hypothetical protein
VIHGRDSEAQKAVFSFLRDLDLHPLEWEELVSRTEQGTPYTGEVVSQAFSEAQAVVALLTPDDQTRLHPNLWRDDEPLYETDFQGQPRPNVFFEAGQAFHAQPDRTILIEIGRMRTASDLLGRNVIRFADPAKAILALYQRLETAGCAVSNTNPAWMDTKRFESLTARTRHKDMQRTGRPSTTSPTAEQRQLRAACQVLRSELVSVQSRLSTLRQSPFLVDPFELPSSEWITNRALVAGEPNLYTKIEAAYSEVDRINYLWRWRRQQATGGIAVNEADDLDAVANAAREAVAAIEGVLGVVPSAQHLEVKPNSLSRSGWGYGRAIDGRLAAAFISVSVVVKELATDDGLLELKCELYRTGEGSAPIASLPLRDPGWLLQAQGPRIERNVMFDLTFPPGYESAPRAAPGDELIPIVAARFRVDRHVESVVLPLILIRGPYQVGS